MRYSARRLLNPYAPSVLPTWSHRVVAAAAGLGMFLAALDISVNVAMPAIARGLEVDQQSVQWVIISFIATRAGLVMGAGSFADQFGLRRVFIFGAVCYLIAVFSISLSPNLETVVGFRVLQGLGAGSFFAVSPALAARVFPADRRGMAMGFATASQALGMLAGTLGAGLLVQWLGWEAVFMGRVPFALVALLLAIQFMKLPPQPQRGNPAESESEDHPFDALGAITLMGALICLVIGLRLGRSEGWTYSAVLTLLFLTPILVWGFWSSERRARWPVLPEQLLRNRGFVVSCTSMFLAHFGVFVVWFAFPFYVDIGLARGAGALGAMLATMALFYTALSWVGGWVCDRMEMGMVGVIGLAVLAGGLLFVSFSGQDTNLAWVALGMAIVGSGLGLFQSAAYALMMSSVPTERMGTGSAALSLAQASGTVFSVAILGGVLALSQEHHLARLLAGGIGGNAVEAQAFVLGFQDVFRIGAGVAALGGVVFLLERFPRMAPLPGSRHSQS